MLVKKHFTPMNYFKIQEFRKKAVFAKDRNYNITHYIYVHATASVNLHKTARNIEIKRGVRQLYCPKAVYSCLRPFD